MKAGVKKSTLRNKADRLFSQLVRLRDGECQRCGSQDMLQCAHLISRRYRKVRWNENNAVALCLRCHKWGTEHPLEWQDWLEETFGRKHYVLLREQALFGKTPDYDVVIPALQERLRELEG